MTTSGTTGLPKAVPHELAELGRRVRPSSEDELPRRWGLLYEPSRFAGMQVVLQALMGRDTLIAGSVFEPFADRVALLARENCTHLSATPSLLRKLLMLPEADRLPLRQITLGGEIAPEPLLNALKARYPSARLTHVYGSTEAGVLFSVKDGKAGFPLAFLDAESGLPPMKIVGDVIWAKPRAEPSGRPPPSRVPRDAEGFVCLNDRVRIEGDRVLFLGREGSGINIGGVKLQLEDVEARLLANPAIADCRCSAKANPILGHVLVFTVVPKIPVEDAKAFRIELKRWCRDALPREAQPADIHVVEQIETTAAGKISRI